MADQSSALSMALIALMKGVVYRESDPALLQSLLDIQARVREYVAPLGLELIFDEAEGYAYLRQRPVTAGEPELPRLVARRPLGYAVSLILVLLRKKLAEHDARGGETRLILNRDEIAELVRVFLPESGNEARLLDRLDSNIGKIVEFGFIRRLRGQEGQFEVQRILKAFVDAQWMQDFEKRLADYQEHGARGRADEA